jgi:hypothetical protein
VYPMFFTINVTNNNFNILAIYLHMYGKLTTDNTTTAGNNYKEIYNFHWDPVTLRNSTLYRAAFKFRYYFGLMMGCIGPK